MWSPSEPPRNVSAPPLPDEVVIIADRGDNSGDAERGAAGRSEQHHGEAFGLFGGGIAGDLHGEGFGRGAEAEIQHAAGQRAAGEIRGAGAGTGAGVGAHRPAYRLRLAEVARPRHREGEVGHAGIALGDVGRRQGQVEGRIVVEDQPDRVVVADRRAARRVGEAEAEPFIAFDRHVAGHRHLDHGGALVGVDGQRAGGGGVVGPGLGVPCPAWRSSTVTSVPIE